jgi:hypothetical protein
MGINELRAIKVDATMVSFISAAAQLACRWSMTRVALLSPLFFLNISGQAAEAFSGVWLAYTSALFVRSLNALRR